ncbi:MULTISPECIES: phage major capsid protein, P2 family [unclassified Vibrio]|uniref:phage major capsid protein, P2 family n=1 Tax=unclassified Vibrio TaxID=2614977 RepID=UPI001360D4C4|nr:MULTISPECIES: phage major capsid protein, P2 family [unclassified Vibrio]NAW58488.1 phage major capsid protein, P2 family [Vibrio sp. V36_P2S2PM302]NAX24960.1 phage major capsid protein, P2 family [Vibrio sp. V38_P2S17PM301]NAX32560.1 phage major capsid protein, P2 family [Vibrio sp. V37_P2S8PM304]
MSFKSTALAKAIQSYCQTIAKGYSVDNTKHMFDVTPPKEVKLREAIIQGSEFLAKINIIDVDQTEGTAVTVGTDKLSTGRAGANEGRFQGTTPDLTGNAYKLQETDTMVRMSWLMQAAWINAGSQGQFNKAVNAYTNKQIAADIVKVGWNGKQASRPTNPETNPLGEDVNEGWQAHVERQAPNQIVKDDGAGGDIYFDPEGTKDANGAPLYTYKTLDSMANDLINNVLAPHHINAPDLVVLVGRELIAAAQYKLYNEADKPSEHNDAQQLAKSIAGRPAYVPAYFPGKRMVVTSYSNLSVYNQRGTKRRKVKDNDDKARLESTYWRMEDYMVEDLEKYAAYDENSVIIGPSNSAPAAPVITTTPSDQTVTVGQTASFNVVAENTTSYEWTLDTAPTGTDSASLDIDTTGMTAGDYTVKVTCIGDGGSKEATATLTVNAA